MAPDDNCLLVRSSEDVDRYLRQVTKAADDVRAWIAAQTGESLDFLRKVKFDRVGYHPVHGHALNFIEQINQTWTYTVALEAARLLLVWHPEAGGFRLAPGANASLPLDIMSVADNLVGAETFAAVDIRNNSKLKNDFAKLARRPEKHRYIFLASPRYLDDPLIEERDGIQIWSITFPRPK